MFGLWTNCSLEPTHLEALQTYLRNALRRTLTRFVSFSLSAVDSTDSAACISVAQLLRSDPALDWLTVREVLCDSKPPVNLQRDEEEEEDRPFD